MKYLHLLAILLGMVNIAQGAEWIDVTKRYVVNPSYEGSRNNGWTIEASAGSTACNYGCQEFWNGTWNLYQSVKLENGHYRISVAGYHRPGAFSNEKAMGYYGGQSAPITSVLYANDESTPLKSVFSASLTENYRNGCWAYNSGIVSEGTVYFPNNMESASYCFQQGMYANELEVDVTDGTLTFGIRETEYENSNWSIFTNWQLEYFGDLVSVTSIALSPKTKTLVIGETQQITATVKPANATIPEIEWTSSMPEVASVDKNGMVMALSMGTAVIRASATDGSGKYSTCRITVSANAVGVRGLIPTEVQSANLDQTVDPSRNYGGWLELYNPGTQAVSLMGCWLSDDPEHLEKVHISQPIAVPAQGYRNLWFEHHDKYCPSQMNMKLDAEGGTLYLSDVLGKLVLTIPYPPAVSRCSYARKSTTGNDWGWSSTPTPEAANEGMVWSEIRLPAPDVDQPTQIFGSSLTVCVNIPQGATLIYTTDGSTPTEGAAEISSDGLFYPSQTTTYRFRLIGNGYLPSQVVTRTYILEDKNFDLPVISVVGNDKDLYSDEMGILTKGNGNGRPGNGQSQACNWNMDWDRTVNFEYLNQEGEMCINQETAMERCGGWSRAWTPYSFKIKANKRYELQSYLPYDFFSDKPFRKHKTMQIRNGGNDTQCRIKDPALQEIVRRSGIDIDCQAYQPVMHYLNGRYAGVINMREPNNKHYVYANYGLDDDEIDQFEMSPDSGYVQKCGTYESMQRWYNLSQQCGTDDNAYEAIRQLVDIDEFCNYMAVEFYLGSYDWPQNNIKAFKPVMEGGRFRFVLFDLDGAFQTTNSFNDFEKKQTYTFDRLYGEEEERITKEIEMVTIFLNMLKNETFRKQFIDTFCLVAGSVFEPNRCKEIITELANRVSDSQSIWNMVYWGSSTPWNTANSVIGSLSSARQSTMVNALKSYSAFDLGRTQAQQVSLSTNIPEARILVNDLPVPTNKFNGRLFAPVTFRAQAPAGYRFQGWKMINGTDANATTLIASEATWQYYDQGSLDEEDWTASNYDSSAWSEGQAPLGYFVGGNRFYNTLLDYGSDTRNKRPTYYFRHSFTLNDQPASADVFKLNYTIDDGLIVYVNGTEAGRYNMPAGNVYYYNFATTYAHGNPDTGTIELPASLFRKGKNVIAVEVHNNEAGSTDILWQAQLTCEKEVAGGEIVSTDEEYQMPQGNMVLQACYEPMTEAERIEQELPTAPVVINEVSAGNSIYVNDYFKKDDWVELYNTTDEDINLEGMYLTDRSQKPQKYQITASGTQASTIIPAHGFKIIWCSKRNTDRQLHANFKLDNEDGTVIRLMAADGSWADSLVYCAHNGDQTVGRYPDGGSQVFLMTQPTIQQSNQFNTYATAWHYEAPDTTDTRTPSISSRSSGMSIAYSSGQLLIKNEELTNVVVSVHTANGSLVMRQSLSMPDGHARVSLSALPAGIYVARARDTEGNECATKFLISF